MVQWNDRIRNINLGQETLWRVKAFKYLGSLVAEDGRMDVNHRIQCGWNMDKDIGSAMRQRNEYEVEE